MQLELIFCCQVSIKMMQGINATKACQDDMAQRHDIISEKLGTIMENQSNLLNNIEHTIKKIGKSY